MDSNLGVLNADILEKFRLEFYSDKKNVLAQNICSKVDPFDVALSRKLLEETQHTFNHKLTNLNPTPIVQAFIYSKPETVTLKADYIAFRQDSIAEQTDFKAVPKDAAISPNTTPELHQSGSGYSLRKSTFSEVFSYPDKLVLEVEFY